ncbi:hypothetical protein HY643_02220 [Candidatus Woesearchaeota archaeon]|nr:hypothetical protein [Candidatus Woesearchaeota archaeon]
MMDEAEILKIADHTYKIFPYKIKKPAFKIFNKTLFIKYLGKDSLLPPHVDTTPAFRLHIGGEECVCFSKEVINRFVKGKPKSEEEDFVKAITLHELYHIKITKEVITKEEAMLAEDEANISLAKDFPELAQVLTDLSDNMD